MKAGLIWFERGHVEYKFPNNAKILQAEIEALEFSMELSSDVPGTSANWPSDSSIWVNDVLIGAWTSPGDSATSAASTRRVGGSSEARDTAI